MSSSPWKKISSRIPYQTPWIQVHEDQVITPSKEPGQYSYIETRGHAVYVVAVTTDHKIYLVNVYRYPHQRYSWEIPAGNAEGQPVLAAAKRELREETGLTAATWRELGCFASCSGIVKEYSYVFLAQGLTQTLTHAQTEEGISAAAPFTLNEIETMRQQGSFGDGQSMAALWLAQTEIAKLSQ